MYIKGVTYYSKVVITGETLGFIGNVSLLVRPLPAMVKAPYCLLGPLPYLVGAFLYTKRGEIKMKNLLVD